MGTQGTLYQRPSLRGQGEVGCHLELGGGGVRSEGGRSEGVRELGGRDLGVRELGVRTEDC